MPYLVDTKRVCQLFCAGIADLVVVEIEADERLKENPVRDMGERALPGCDVVSRRCAQSPMHG